MNILEDYRQLIDVLCDYDCPVRIGFQAIGHYHRILVYQLVMTSLELHLVSAVRFVLTQEALRNSLDKNDRKDAQVIVRILEIGRFRTFIRPESSTNILKSPKKLMMSYHSPRSSSGIIF